MDVAQKIKLEPLVTDDPEVSLDHPASEQEIEYRDLMRNGIEMDIPVVLILVQKNKSVRLNFLRGETAARSECVRKQ